MRMNRSAFTKEQASEYCLLIAGKVEFRDYLPRMAAIKRKDTWKSNMVSQMNEKMVKEASKTRIVFKSNF